MAAIISVTHLSKKFKDFTAVDDLSFTVNEGDVYGFLGQNGAGKSTTIRMLLTLIKPTSGNINMFGMNLNTHRSEILQQAGAVIEKPDLYKYLTAYQNLYIFAKMSGIKVTRQLLMEQLDMVGLAERAHSKVKTFSQGMKQRLGIAVALVHNPKLIVLDEPTNGLTEASETLACFAFMCLWPEWFIELAYGFAFLCAITTSTRLWWGWQAFR